MSNWEGHEAGQGGIFETPAPVTNRESSSGSGLVRLDYHLISRWSMPFAGNGRDLGTICEYLLAISPVQSRTELAIPEFDTITVRL